MRLQLSENSMDSTPALRICPVQRSYGLVQGLNFPSVKGA